MQTQNKRPFQTKDSPTPYSDFEISVSSTLVGEKKKISKGRFVFWGDVRSADLPA